MGEYFVHSEQMTVGYDGKPLIRDIEIRLNRGEILTLIGPNGAGKSTILKSLTRQLKLVGGTVYLDQKLMSQMSGKEVAQKLAVVTTERIRPELMTCEDIIQVRWESYRRVTGKRYIRQWKWSMHWILRTEILPRSVMDSDRGFCWPEQSARNQK